MQAYYHIVFVPSIDNIYMRDKRKVVNALTQDFEFYKFDIKTGPAMMYHLYYKFISYMNKKYDEIKTELNEVL